MALIFVTPKVPETYTAWRGHGEVGSLHVERVEYGKRCRYFGTWKGRERSRILSKAWVDDLNHDDCRYQVGAEIRSLYVGNPKTVYVAGDYAYWFAIVISGVSAAYLLGLAAIVGLTAKRKRETRA